MLHQIFFLQCSLFSDTNPSGKALKKQQTYVLESQQISPEQFGKMASEKFNKIKVTCAATAGLLVLSYVFL